MKKSASEFIAGALSSTAAKRLLKSLNEKSLVLSRADKVKYWVAEHDGLVAGVFGVRLSNHVLHCLVEKRFHRCGVGLALWNFVLRAASSADLIDHFTVNSSVYALPFYEALRFAAVSDVTVREGVKFIPMQINLSHVEKEPG